MVLFSNIMVGQRVEVKGRGRIHKGTIKFKGVLNGSSGEWVGVALDQPVGKHDGMICGRRYFSCPPYHGIFTVANNIRFIPLKRCLYNNYRKVVEYPSVEEDLFGNYDKEEIGRADEPIVISDSYFSRAKSPSYPAPSSPFDRPRSFHLRHSIGNTIAPATLLRPESARASFCYSTRPIHSAYDIDEDDFITSPSIPKSHMPHSALTRQVRRGWDSAHYVREMSVHTGRDSIKYSQWNDISP